MNITGDSIRRQCNCPVIQLALNGMENDTGLDGEVQKGGGGGR